jgi:TP901 family phage tail tape measure protein
MSMSITAPLVAMGGLAVKTFAEFEQSMAKVNAVSGATATQFKALNQLAKDLGASTRFTATEVADLMLNYSKLGFSASEIEAMTGATLNLALATGEDLAKSAEVAGSTLRAFGLDADQMLRVTDVMAKSFSSSALDLDRFSESMKYVAPVAAAAGISLEEASAMLSILANNGIKGSQAGTSLRRIITDLGATGGNVAGAIANLANKGLNLGECNG